MLDCPSDLQLTLFLEGQLSKKDALDIRLHSVRCAECALIVEAGLALQDLEAADRLPTVSAREAAEAVRRLRGLAGSMKDHPSDESSSPQSPEPGIGARFKDLFSGFVIATGLSGWREALEHIARVPGLAQKNNSDDAVRNDGFPASQSTTDSEENADEKASNVIGPTTSPLQDCAPTNAERPVMDEHALWSWQQGHDASAVLSQALILRDFGAEMSEEDLHRESAALNWPLENAGAPSMDFGNLLERYGVPIHRYEGATIDNLANELAQGHKVIVSLGSDQRWPAGLPDRFEEALSKTDALLICEIDTTDPLEPHVKLIDPVLGEAIRSYPLESFIDAWKDTSCFMVATAEPAPLALNPGMANFDYALGHLPAFDPLAGEGFQRQLLPTSEEGERENPSGDATSDIKPSTNERFDSGQVSSSQQGVAGENGEEQSAIASPTDLFNPFNEHWSLTEDHQWPIPDDPAVHQGIDYPSDNGSDKY